MARQGRKSTTWRGVPIDEYRKARETMTPEAFEKWVIKATGKPRMRNNVIGKNKFSDMQRLFPQKEMTLVNAKKVIDNLGKALQKEQRDHALTANKYKETKALLAKLCVDLQKERSRSWIRRLFNLK